MHLYRFQQTKALLSRKLVPTMPVMNNIQFAYGIFFDEACEHLKAFSFISGDKVAI